jgi:hypothetical protein
MAEAHDQKEFLELLIEFTSDETKKARRNASLIAFVVIAAYALGVRIADIKVFGADISRSSDVPVFAIAALLLAYWVAMFLLAHWRDVEIQKERSRRLEGQISSLMARWDYVQKKHTETNGTKSPHDYGEVKGYVDALNAQRERTAKAARFGGVMKKLELFVPLGLSAVAFFILGVGVHNAL